MIITLTLLLAAVSFTTYYIAYKFEKKMTKYENEFLNSRNILLNKEHFSKIQIQKAQQFLDKHVAKMR